MVYGAHVYVVNTVSLKSVIYQLNYILLWYIVICKCLRSGEVLLWSRHAETAENEQAINYIHLYPYPFTHAFKLSYALFPG